MLKFIIDFFYFSFLFVFFYISNSVNCEAPSRTAGEGMHFEERVCVNDGVSCAQRAINSSKQTKDVVKIHEQKW